MDLNADMLISNIPEGQKIKVLSPIYRKFFGLIPGRFAKNADRLFNRLFTYPNYLKNLDKSPGFFHIVDHSYSHLVHYLPSRITGVYCHDLDAFRCILEPDKEKRPIWFQKISKHIFNGFLKAKIVFCNCEVTKKQILGLNHWSDDSVYVVPPGICKEYCPNGDVEGGDYLLHVGSCIPRKRIDFLLDIFSLISQDFPGLKLIQAGGCFTRRQINQIDRLRLNGKVEQKRNLSRQEIAKLYRGAKCLLVTSESEGFGLPTAEALSCGCPVIASDIPNLREAGGSFAFYSPVGDLVSWVRNVTHILKLGKSFSLPKFKGNTWDLHAKQIFDIYSNF